METAVASPVVDARQWIYDLTKDEKIGREKSAPNGAHNSPNGNFIKELRAPVTVSFDGRHFELPRGTELVVYRQIKPLGENGTWGAQGNSALATVFMKRNGMTVRQITVYMSGRIKERRFF